MRSPKPDTHRFVLRATRSRRRRPRPDDVLLVVEVANTSLRYDRETRAPLYARAGIPEYWIVDLNGEQIEVYREPSPAGYRSLRLYGRGEMVTPAYSADLTILVDTILGPTGAADDDDQTSADEPPSPADH